MEGPKDGGNITSNEFKPAVEVVVQQPIIDGKGIIQKVAEQSQANQEQPVIGHIFKTEFVDLDAGKSVERSTADPRYAPLLQRQYEAERTLSQLTPPLAPRPSEFVQATENGNPVWRLRSEFIQGSDLNRIAWDKNPKAVAALALKMSSYLNRMHTEGKVASSDIKPANVRAFPTSDGNDFNVMLVDFDTSKPFNSPPVPFNSDTRRYLDPRIGLAENLRNDNQAFNEAMVKRDWAALGISLLEMRLGPEKFKKVISQIPNFDNNQRTQQDVYQFFSKSIKEIDEKNPVDRAIFILAAKLSVSQNHVTGIQDIQSELNVLSRVIGSESQPLPEPAAVTYEQLKDTEIARALPANPPIGKTGTEVMAVLPNGEVNTLSGAPIIEPVQSKPKIELPITERAFVPGIKTGTERIGAPHEAITEVTPFHEQITERKGPLPDNVTPISVNPRYKYTPEPPPVSIHEAPTQRKEYKLPPTEKTPINLDEIRRQEEAMKKKRATSLLGKIPGIGRLFRKSA
jgi:hypothetical protein